MTVVVGTHFQHSTLPFSSFRAKPVHVIVTKNSADCMNGRAAPIMISSDVATQHQQRRSGNYEPGQWGLDIPHQLLQAKYDNAAAANRTSAEYSGYSRLRIEELKRYVKGLLEIKHVEENDETNMVKRLELIDALQRLGLGYHFEREIQAALEAIIASSSSHKWAESLHACALRFRLLRQAGMPVSPDIFQGFKDDNGGFKAQIVRDVKGLLELYEASYLGLTGEDIIVGKIVHVYYFLATQANT